MKESPNNSMMKSLGKVPYYYTLLLRKNNPKKLRPGFFYSYQDKANFLRKSAFCVSMNQCNNLLKSGETVTG